MRFLRLFLATALLVCFYQTAFALSLKSILQQTKINTVSTTAQFAQTRHLHFLKKPLVSKGHFYFKKPAYLEQKIITPTKRTFIINGQHMKIINADNSSKVIDLFYYPNLSALAMTLQTLLTGDSSFLHQYYEVKTSGSLNNWQIQLVPKPNVRLNIQSIIAKGSRNLIKKITLHFKNGDWIQQRLFYKK